MSLLDPDIAKIPLITARRPSFWAAVPWPAFDGTGSAQMLSLVPPQPQIETDFTTRHHCAFWAAG